MTSARLSFNLRELQLPPTIAHHRVALRTRPPPPPPVVHPRSTIAASTHEHPFYFCTVQPTPSSLSPRPDGGTDLSSRVKLVERANARHELNSISIIGRALHNREVLIPIPATTDSRHSRPAIERHGLHLHDPPHLTASLPPPTRLTIPMFRCSTDPVSYEKIAALTDRYDNQDPFLPAYGSDIGSGLWGGEASN